MEKRVDSEWKKKAQEEKEKVSEESSREKQPSLPEASFLNFISDISLQIMILLGQIEHPATKKKEKNLSQAKYMIDTLEMLEEKTRGNLSSQESMMLTQLLHQFRMTYVASVSEKSVSETDFSESQIIT